ncbi:hypothetical protein MesoLjLc_21040 [Mesorhizobium sp. L-8-10]|uniref:copper-binding protein n=1 Tax=unclassified Mesorhizobium TaxID=325217 RepID=UPI0019281A0F|nr:MULTISPECIES: copper-binding protein [unclassified Mesorhizobium]BCH22360.1 hypothetical protein MesoLjLb_21450 [Mesorhizobium sp. L-8-3]BCH30174.1 hypothetical protein MesoLjLc_21040 [Mesorhizobium sp. L-8-10]
MKSIFRLSAAALIALATTAAFAAEYTKGVVTKIDTKQNKLTIKHEELKDLGMSAMTMVFVAGDPEMIGKVKEGQAIEFVADRVNGRLTVTEIK